MNIINSREAQNHFGDLMNQAIKEPVVIQKHGKPCAVLISHEEYKKFLELEDFYWDLKARQASEEGFLSKEESKDFLNSILKAR